MPNQNAARGDDIVEETESGGASGELLRSSTSSSRRSDAIERVARRLGLLVDMDEPEQALETAVRRRLAELQDGAQLPGKPSNS